MRKRTLLFALAFLSCLLVLALSFLVYGQAPSPATPAAPPSTPGMGSGTISAIVAGSVAVIGGLTGLVKMVWDILKEFRGLISTGIPVKMDPEQNKPFLEEIDKRRAKQCAEIHKNNGISKSEGVNAVVGCLLLLAIFGGC